MQFRRHQSARDGGIGLHERARGGLIGRLEYRNAKRLVTWLLRASSKDQLTRFCGFLESSEVPLKHCFVFLRPIRIRIEPRYEPQHIDELLMLFSLRCLSRQGLTNCESANQRNDESEVRHNSVFHFQQDFRIKPELELYKIHQIRLIPVFSFSNRRCFFSLELTDLLLELMLKIAFPTFR